MSLKDSELDPDADKDSASEETEDETVAYGETDEWGSNDLEAAYRKALEANDNVEWEFNHLDPAVESTKNDDPPEESPNDAVADDVAAATDEDSEPASQPNSNPNPIPQRVTARQVIEAAIFVGGEPLTSKKLCYMLKGDYDLDAVERAIEDLNLQYSDEARPYEFRLGEGGYRMVLREEFERIRNRVFGIGPREVKLSQDVLEVLALVAYRQPITSEEIEELGKEKPTPLLRQLLRRELISLERDIENRKRVTYSTSKRFLSLFGIGSLNELPQADELAFK
ncbi:MAG: SMC-Scp complex subunit ScpB [Planctomycetaceae bacterium]|nr:SMC-Scp complex subunit ScpB [Planctomycetaceae bacterium]